MQNDLEIIVLSHLAQDEGYARKVLPHLNEEYFSRPESKALYSFINSFISEYNKQPTFDAISVMLENSPLDEGMYTKTSQLLGEATEVQKQHTDWLVDETEKWVKDRAIHNALMQAIDITMGKDSKKTKEAIPDILSKALAVTFDTSGGYDWAEKAEERYLSYHLKENKIGFPIEWLNKETQGGVTNKTLTVYLGKINGGKSVLLCHLAGYYMQMGLNVVYFSMEMDENVVGERVDVNLLDLNFEQVRKVSKSQYLARVKKVTGSTQGKLKVKQFPTGGAHVGHFRHYLDELKMKEGFVPDIIIVDYITIMASSKLPSSMKSNSNTYFTSVAEELRGFAIERDVPIFTAAQYGRAQQNAAADDAHMSDIAVSIGIGATADLMIAGVQPDELAQRDEIIWKILKNRFGPVGKSHVLGADMTKQRYYALEAEPVKFDDSTIKEIEDGINKEASSKKGLDDLNYD